MLDKTLHQRTPWVYTSHTLPYSPTGSNPMQLQSPLLTSAGEYHRLLMATSHLLCRTNDSYDNNKNIITFTIMNDKLLSHPLLLQNTINNTQVATLLY